MAVKEPKDLLTHELKDIVSAERQLTRAIPKLMKAVQSEALKGKLEERRGQGERLLEELDTILEDMGATKSRPKNVAAEGLINDTLEHIDEIEDAAMLDSALLSSVQKTEHYCIAAWGTAKALGRMLEQDEVVKVMERVLEEGKTMDGELNDLAEGELADAMMKEAA